MFDENELIPISSLQHLLYCERQFALIHLEQLWCENQFTVEGMILHERVDVQHHESRRKEKQEFALHVRSLELGLIGICDLVEIRYDLDNKLESINPIEFKRGKTKPSNVDLVQLCAQSLCLEEMLSVRISSGEIYYLQEHRRSTIRLDAALVDETKKVIIQCREILASGITPSASFETKKCNNCSLLDLCLPKQTGLSGQMVSQYVNSEIQKIKKEDY